MCEYRKVDLKSVLVHSLVSVL